MTKDCPVEILQYAWEFDAVIDLYKRVKPRTILEIGSLYGGTIYHWLDKANWCVKIASLDLFATIDYVETVKQWERWVKYNQTLVVSKVDSTSLGAIEFVKKELAGTIDWLFIDGDHTYEGAKKDYDNYFPMVTKNGHCIFHDIFGESGVAKLWQEIKQSDISYIEICHSKYHLGIGVIQKWSKDE